MQGLCEIRNITKKCSVRAYRFDCISQFSVQFKIQLLGFIGGKPVRINERTELRIFFNAVLFL